MLQARNVVKTFPGGSKGERLVHAVQDVSFDIEEGEFFTLLGPSGCGKTTLLRSIAGLEQPDSGEIWIDGALMFGARQGVRTNPDKRPIGMVFQSYAIWPHMTVYDNVAFPLVHGRQRMGAAKAQPLVQKMLERVSLGEYASSWATKLSGGQQQRLALARALVCQPKLLLLDEPLSNLDAALRKTMRQELKECQRSFGVTTLYVTHDQNEALALSDRLAVLKDGRTIQVGTPREIYEQPADSFVARFVGDANVFQGRVVEAGARSRVESVFGVVACNGGAGRAEGDSVSCFVRPESIRIDRVSGSGAGAGHISGRVTALDYVGERQECTLSRGDSELRGWTPPDVTLSIGDEAWVDLESAGISILPKRGVQEEQREASHI